MYTIIQYDDANGTPDEDCFYLNHSCMNTLSFGSLDMAWTTNDYLAATQMLGECQNRSQELFKANTIFELREY